MAKLEGPDVSVEISLKEYGIAWEIGETETRFYYGVKYNGVEFIRFDWADLENNLEFDIEFDWAEFLDVADMAGIPITEWNKLPMTLKIQDLLSYYAAESVFGSPHTEPMTYEEIIRGK